MKKNEIFINAIKEVLKFAKYEVDKIDAGGPSKWNIDQLGKIVIPEMNELLIHAIKGIVFFKYGKRQRLLESSYLMTDSLEKLSDTTLGKKISELQKLYNSL